MKRLAKLLYYDGNEGFVTHPHNRKKERCKQKLDFLRPYYTIQKKKFPHEQILNQEFLAFQVRHKHSSAVYSDNVILNLTWHLSLHMRMPLSKG